MTEAQAGELRTRASTVKVRERNGRWVAGWYDDRFSPSAASGDLGFYAGTPEEAVRLLLGYVFDALTTKGD